MNAFVGFYTLRSLASEIHQKSYSNILNGCIIQVSKHWHKQPNKSWIQVLYTLLGEIEK